MSKSWLVARRGNLPLRRHLRGLRSLFAILRRLGMGDEAGLVTMGLVMEAEVVRGGAAERGLRQKRLIPSVFGCRQILTL